MDSNSELCAVLEKPQPACPQSFDGTRPSESERNRGLYTLMGELALAPPFHPPSPFSIFPFSPSFSFTTAILLFLLLLFLFLSFFFACIFIISLMWTYWKGTVCEKLNWDSCLNVWWGQGPRVGVKRAHERQSRNSLYPSHSQSVDNCQVRPKCLTPAGPTGVPTLVRLFTSDRGPRKVPKDSDPRLSSFKS